MTTESRGILAALYGVLCVWIGSFVVHLLPWDSWCVLPTLISFAFLTAGGVMGIMLCGLKDKRGGDEVSKLRTEPNDRQSRINALYIAAVHLLDRLDNLALGGMDEVEALREALKALEE